MSRGRGRRGGHEEEHENHERWLVSYADMMTLLMVLFVVLFAIGQVDQRKFAMLKEGLSQGFGATASVPITPRTRPASAKPSPLVRPCDSRTRRRATAPNTMAMGPTTTPTQPISPQSKPMMPHTSAPMAIPSVFCGPPHGA